jgi:hypothetical protein
VVNKRTNGSDGFSGNVDSKPTLRTDVSCHCDLVSGKCPKNFLFAGTIKICRYIQQKVEAWSLIDLHFFR